MESVMPFSGQYSVIKDLKLSAWAGVAVATYALTRKLLHHYPDWGDSWSLVIALTPLIPGLLWIRNFVRFYRGLDELQRRMQLEVWLFAVMGTLFAEVVISAMNAKGVHFEKFQYGLGVGGVIVVMVFLWVLGSIISTRRYK